MAETTAPLDGVGQAVALVDRDGVAGSGAVAQASASLDRCGKETKTHATPSPMSQTIPCCVKCGIFLHLP